MVRGKCIMVDKGYCLIKKNLLCTRRILSLQCDLGFFRNRMLTPPIATIVILTFLLILY